MPNSLGITFVLPMWSDVPIGGYKVVFDYANGLEDRNHRVNIIFPSSFHRYGEVTQKSLFSKVIRRIWKWFERESPPLPSLNWYSLSPEVKLHLVPTLDEIYIPRSDMIFATSWHTAEWVNSYRPDKGAKYYLIQSFETWSGPEKDVKETWKMPLKKIVIASWLKDIALQLNEEIIAYIPNGIDLSVFKLTTPIEDRDPKRIGMIYWTDPVKGSQDGIDALRFVKDSMPDIRVTFFSIHPRGQNVPEWVDYYHDPTVNTICELYNSFGIFVSPSLIEGWPLPPAEAMACGCAVISTDNDGIREYAVDEHSALLSPPHQPKELANNILKLINNRQLRLSLAWEGNKHIQQFSRENAINKFIEVIESEKLR